MDEILEHTEHRPWPLPRGPWILKQVWHDLLFAHWLVAVDAVRALIPAQLEIDTFGGWAWCHFACRACVRAARSRCRVFRVFRN